ncbi:hypothetical protein HMN09_01421900 [Mycena chlorophos]|uniref:WH1-domain-containing protein n=1 Tax=Mycena chlorophos TaxID=658473 RepID=A0A8H6RVM2_MYCCL|nr:hypothetical protein HMN09_01421900 [Mycena chlorophos]
MPSQSTLSGDDKAKVKTAIPASSNKIATACLARIYYAHPSPNKWSYAGLQGALAFVKDNTKNTHYFRMVDLTGTRGVIWEHELYDGLQYQPDTAYLHSFPSDNCMVAFVFADEREGKTFWKKVTQRKESKGAKPASDKKKKANKGGKIDKSMISAPDTSSFKHLGHMGYDESEGFTSKGVDPSWAAFLGQLENSGVDKKIIAKEIDFIKDYVRQHPQAAAPKEPKKPKPPPPPSRRGAHAQNDSTSSSVISPPPPPPPRAKATSHPPPPPVRSPTAPAPPARPPPTSSGPPPPPARPSTGRPTPVPPPRAQSTVVAPPPPPPRPSAGNGIPPPPPPPPPPGGSGVPPPPPPPPPAGLPTPQPGRSALLESIQSHKGVNALRKTDGAPPPRAIPEEPASPTSAGGGAPDLTTALAEALMLRNKNMGDSDDEDEEDDEWD